MRKLVFVFLLLLITISLLNSNALPNNSKPAAPVDFGERPFIDIFQVPDEAIESGRIRIKLTDQYSGLTDRLEQHNGTFKNFGISALDRLNSRSGISESHIVFYSPSQNDKFAWRHRLWGLDRWFELRFDAWKDVRSLVMAYRELKGIVAWAEPCYKKTLLYDPTQMVPYNPDNNTRWSSNDPRLAEQWHYNNTGQQSGTPGCDIDLFSAWDIEKGLSDVVVAVVDQGIQYNHPDLAANMWINPGEIAGNGIDDDANGYVDDIYGYNFYGGSGTISPGDHGSHTSGTISAVTNNAVGVAGIAGGDGTGNGVRLMSCQVFSSSSGGDGFEVAPIYGADNDAAISQNSWSYTSAGVYEQPVLDAIDYFNANGGGHVMTGGITIYSAGNSNSSSAYYPGYYSGTLAVAATNNQDIKSYYSNYGTWVNVSAPGGETNSVTARGVLSCISGSSYAFYQGTSMACPHTSGEAALVISYAYRNGRTLSNSELATIITSTTDDHYSVNPSYTGLLGSGRINAYSALLAADPTIPSCTITSPGNGSFFNINDIITVNVTATDTDGTITGVDFYIDEDWQYTDSSSPYAWNWDTTGYSGGTHVVKVIAIDDSSNAVQREITVTLLTTPDEGFETGDFTALPWLQSGNLPWVVQTAEKLSGTYAARSGAITDSQTSTMAVTLNITTAGNISFYQKTSSEATYDFLYFYIDNVQQGSWSGIGNWSLQTYAVTTGSHEFKWTYDKDGSVSSGSDCAYLDHLIFPAYSPPNPYYPPQNLIAFAGNGYVNLTWSAPALGTPTGYQIYRNSAYLTTVTGLNYTDNAVTNGTLYSYYLIASYAGGDSDPTQTVTATPDNQVVIGTGTLITLDNYISPINISYKSLHGQSVYTATELNAAGVTGPVYITQVGFYVDTPPDLALPNFIVRMKHTTDADVTNWQTATDMVTVYSSPSYMPTPGGYDLLTLSSPFLWNGTDNIVLDTAFDMVADWSHSGTVQYTSQSYGYRAARSDTENQADVFTGGFTYSRRPNIKLVLQTEMIESVELSVTFGTIPGSVKLIWTTSPGSPDGYNVYFSAEPDFADPILLEYVTAPDTTYIDDSAYLRPWGFYRVTTVKN